jgi:hypothetical protein
MSVILFVLLASASVPDVTAGPGLSEEAKVIEAAIENVTVFSDRAKVVRRATVNLDNGIHKLGLPDLPGAVMINTVRIECSGARVIRVETVPVERERFSIEQVEEQISKLEAITDKLSALDRESQVYNLELSFLNGISPRAPVEESKRVGKPLPPVRVDLWKKVLDFLQARKNACRASLRKQALKRRELQEQFTKVQREVQRHNLGAFTDRKVQVLAIVQVRKPGKVRLDLEYFVPGASWKPAYNIHFDPERGKVTIKTAGMVRQATGEDWINAAVSLSTAIPGLGIQLPELLTWALGEKREFIPRPRAARMPPAAARFPPPQPQPTPFEAERQARLQVLQGRIAKLQNMLSMAVDERSISTLAGLDSGGAGVGAGYGMAVGSLASRRDYAEKKAEHRYRKPSRSKRRPMPSVAEAMPAAPPPMEEMELARPSSVSTQRVSTRGRKGRTLATSLGLFEPVYYNPPRFSDSSLPAVVAGGLDYVYACPTRASIPSSGEDLRVPLAAESYPVETFYEATPSLKKTAYLKAKVTNQGERPILQGPANIFVGKDFIGQGQLRTTGKGGVIDLPLGADENIRILHKVVPATVTKGIISKDEITTYTQTIEIGNYKKKAISINVYDQIPKTRNEDIEIEKGSISPKPETGPDEDGIMRFLLRIPPGKIKTIQFSYKIKRPVNWQLSQ